MLEQLDWIADEIADSSRDAWVLPVGKLSDEEESRIIAQARADGKEEYRQLRADAKTLSPAAAERRRSKIAARDHFR